ncbi:MAG: hypothetical protein KGH89_03560 [Thaumarchaeota archaeon]|nr:hypothetical protein [Nitrososphaerota archaeon]
MTHSQCAECRKTIQKICKTCSILTRKQFHNRCGNQPIPISHNGNVLEIVQKKRSFSKFALIRSVTITLGVLGLFILGFATAASLDIFQDHPVSATMTKSGNTPVPQVYHTVTTSNSLQDCIAYGSGESVTVTCPTQYGYVYKAILDMPQDLASKFADSVFSIRGVSVIEHSDGSVILQYQNNDYITNFFAS